MTKRQIDLQHVRRNSRYGFNITLSDSFGNAVERTTEALKTEGFGVPTDIDPGIGLLLPCNVVVREQPDKEINVGFMDPIVVLKLTDNPAVTSLAK